MLQVRIKFMEATTLVLVQVINISIVIVKASTKSAYHLNPYVCMYVESKHWQFLKLYL